MTVPATCLQYPPNSVQYAQCIAFFGGTPPGYAPPVVAAPVGKGDTGIWLLAFVTLWVILTLMLESKELTNFTAALAWLIAGSATYAVFPELDAEYLKFIAEVSK